MARCYLLSPLKVSPYASSILSWQAVMSLAGAAPPEGTVAEDCL